MSKEIERKFLVDKRVWVKDVLPTQPKFKLIEQGYLSKSVKHNIRIRMMGTSVALLTIKGKRKGITRDEFEYEIPIDDARVMLEMCDDGISQKTRYTLKVGKFVWTVDHFHGINEGLLLAEIELEHEDQQFTKPVWITKEVSHDRRYTNTYLTTHKVPVS